MNTKLANTTTPSAAAANMLATGFYSGYCPVAPGTAGTLAAAAGVYLLSFAFPALAMPLESCLLAVFTTALGILCANVVCDSQLYGADNKDPKQIVIDEFSGYFVTIIGLEHNIASLAVAFACFRLFDILKPPPIKRLERLPRGWGIVLDDVLAGVYAALLARIVLHIAPRLL